MKCVNILMIYYLKKNVAINETFFIQKETEYFKNRIRIPIVMGKLTPIRGIQIFFTLFGYNFNIVHRIEAKLLLWMILALNLIIVNISAILEFKTDRNMSLVQTAIHKYQIVLYWWFYHSFIFKVPSICHLVVVLSKHLRYDDIVRCRKSSYFIFISLILMFFPNIFIISKFKIHIHRLANQLGIETNSLNITVMMIYRVYQYSTYNWLIISNFMYDNLIYLLYQAKRNLIECIDQSSKQLHKKSMINRIHESTNSMQAIHREFESILSIYPFLAISDLFFIVSLNIFILKRSSNMVGYIIFQLVIKICETTFIVIFVSYLTNKLKSFIDDVCERINADHRIESTIRIQIVRMIKDASSHAHTGWGMFDLELPLILSFLGSHITFTLLFLSE